MDKRDLGALTTLGACSEAVEWARQFKTKQEAWDKCERGDWMLWFVGKQSGEPNSDTRKKLVLVACKCARLALPFVKTGENRPLAAIETAEKWARGEDNITLNDVRVAASYAADAADVSASYAASAVAASYAAASIAYVADAASAANAARVRVLKQCADIVRTDYPTLKGGSK